MISLQIPKEDIYMTNVKEHTSSIQADLGKINITTGVLESIAAKAANEVEGVVSTQTHLQKQAGDFLGFDSERFKASIKQTDQGLVIDVRVRVKFGYKVPEVALDVQNKIKEQILYMTDIKVSQVHVHVESIEADYYQIKDGDQLD